MRACCSAVGNASDGRGILYRVMVCGVERSRRGFMKNNCCVYIACRMTGRDRVEQVRRARYICDQLKQAGITPISPVIDEKVPATPGPLIPASREELRGHWTRDKHIITRLAHVILFDGADEGSVGMGREYGFARYALWKPTIILWHSNRGITVADFEDDAIVLDIPHAIKVIYANYFTRSQRWRWRAKMLARSFPKWILRQIYAWR
jgi:hypothetical protein